MISSEFGKYFLKKQKNIEIRIGTNKSYKRIWQSPDLPSPTILAAPDKEGGAGWILIIENDSMVNSERDKQGK